MGEEETNEEPTLEELHEKVTEDAENAAAREEEKVGEREAAREVEEERKQAEDSDGEAVSDPETS